MAEPSISILQQIDDRKIFTVSEVTRDLKNLLEDNFASVWISGEVSNIHAAASGHFYFTLKDDKAALQAVMFRQDNRRLKFEIQDGLEIIAHGRISVYEPRGQHQIIVDILEPKGWGALQLAFEQLRRRLASEGLFDESHKKPLPTLPRTVGVVTSEKGAAVHDIVTVLRRRYPNIDILIYPVKVQGEGSAQEIAEAIEDMNRLNRADVLIVGRGGGSLEDLWAFNEEIVVRAVYNSNIPVISAVGHEVDVTLTDLVADLRAPTPSAAAEMAVPEKRELTELITQNRSALMSAVLGAIESFRENLDFLRKQLRDPRRIIEALFQKIDDLSLRLNRAEQGQVRSRQSEFLRLLASLPDPSAMIRERRIALDGLKARLVAASPGAVLKRGYGIVYKVGESSPIRLVSQLKTDDLIVLELIDGSVKARVTGD